MSLQPIKADFGGIKPLERISNKEARELVASAIRRGLIKPGPVESAYDDARRDQIKHAMRRVRGGVDQCNKGEPHDPNINGYCTRCGRKVMSLHAEPANEQ